MKRFIGAALVVVFIGVAESARGADKADPTGTWKWTVTFNNNTRDVTLKLKLEGEKLTGKISGRNNTERDIENATFKDDEVSFSVTRERDGQKFVTKYKGKLDGNTIKGKAEFERDGQTQSRDWEAKREKTT
jgi:hypothetical protein